MSIIGKQVVVVDEETGDEQTFEFKDSSLSRTWDSIMATGEGFGFSSDACQAGNCGVSVWIY